MTDRIEAARARLEAQWESEGGCQSCGWHGLLYEHDVDDADIEDALKNGGVLKLSCVSKDAVESWSHRGVRVYIGEPTTTDTPD